MLWYCRTFQLYPGAGQVRGHVSPDDGRGGGRKKRENLSVAGFNSGRGEAVLRPETYPDGELFGKAAVMFLCMA